MTNKADTSEGRPGLTFHEKSLWISLLATIVLFSYYFWRAFSIGSAGAGHVGVLFVEVVILAIVIQIVCHIAVAIYKRPERTDERDRRIALAATRNSYYVLAVGAWCVLGVAVMSFGTYWIANALLLALVVADLSRLGSELAYYRRGV